MEADRINYTFGFKRNLGNYQTAHASLTYSSEVKPGETSIDAYGRVVKFVEDEIEKKWNQMDGKCDLEDVRGETEWQE